MQTVTVKRICLYCDKYMGTMDVDPLTAVIGRKDGGMCPECVGRHLYGLKPFDQVIIKDLPWCIGNIIEFLEVDGVGACVKVQVENLTGTICRRFDEVTNPQPPVVTA